MICVLVLAAGQSWEAPALGRLEGTGSVTVLKRCVDVDDLLAVATTGQAGVAVVALDAPGLDPAAVEHLKRHGVRLVAVATGPDLEAGELARRLRIDAVVGEEDLHLLVDVVTSADEQRSQPPEVVEHSPLLPVEPVAAPEDRRTIVVWGPTGAPGRTTVAVNLAAEIARRQRHVVLADLDPQGGAVAQQLGVLDEVSGVLAGARLAGAGQLGERFDSVCRGVGEHLAVVTGLPRADRWREVRPAHVEELLAEAALRGDVVVDTGFGIEDDDVELGRTPRHAMTLGALDMADELVVVGSADPVGLARLARALVDLAERGVTIPSRVVVNRMRSTIGWTEREIAGMVEGFSQTAGLHFLPEDRGAVDRALVTGQPLIEGGDGALTRGISALADALLPGSVLPDMAPSGLGARTAAFVRSGLVRQRRAGRAHLR